MREFKFKARCVNSRWWAHGGIYQDSIGTYIVSTLGDDVSLTAVDPDTVCQFTGLYAVGHSPIYEGDLVELARAVFEVKFKNGAFCLETAEGQPKSYPHLPSCAENCKIVGSIHDKETK